MKILLWSCSFYPSIGGIETVTEILAREFAGLGHEVTVLTRTVTTEPEPEHFPFKVVRKPSALHLLRLVAHCDVFVHSHLSLKVAFPLLLFRRPWLVAYHTWYPNTGLRGWLRPLVSRFALNVACSRAVAEYTDSECLVIPNAYDDRTFRKIPESKRDRELVFVGRLIRDKGVHVLLDALSLLADEGIRPRLTVVGQGSDSEYLAGKSSELGLTRQVTFIGAKSGPELAAILNRHKFVVVPSLWREPFGIVALEAIACGCIAIGSEGGGLSEAVGPCGLTFPNGDAPALANVLRRLLQSPETWPAYREAAADHLRSHTPMAVAAAYLDAINRVRTSGPALARSGIVASRRRAPQQAANTGSYRRETPIRILLWSCSFDPNIGGLETMAEILAREFTSMGQHVTVITRTAECKTQAAGYPFAIVRNPSCIQLFRLVAACDVFVHNHLSLKVAYPLLFFRRPWIVVYHCLYPTSGMRGWLQPHLARFALNFACSNSLASLARPECRVIPNAYDDRIFRKSPAATRGRELIFVGRLIMDKGVQLLLDALILLRATGLRPALTVVGGGADSNYLERKSVELGLTDQVAFVGKRSGRDLAAILNDHRILVVPSIVHEAFGIVALEAIACGCVVVGSEGGGLKEAIGPCGVTFPSGDVPALAKTLKHLLVSPETLPQYTQSADDHLRKHTSTAVANAYLDVIGSVTRGGRIRGNLGPADSLDSARADASSR
jgi:glycogen synthase